MSNTLQVNTPYNWQVNNDSFGGTFRGSAQCGPTSACTVLSAFVPQASTDDYVKSFISEMDGDWLSKKSKIRLSAFQSNYSKVLQSHLDRHSVQRKVVTLPSGGTLANVEESLRSGSPLMASTKLTKDGHYLVIVGYDYDSKEYVVHDPYGLYDFASSSYKVVKDGVGANARYPAQLFEPFLVLSSKAAVGPRATGFRLLYTLPK